MVRGLRDCGVLAFLLPLPELRDASGPQPGQPAMPDGVWALALALALLAPGRSRQGTVLRDGGAGRRLGLWGWGLTSWMG